MILFLTIVLVLYTATLLWIWVGQWKLPRTHKLSITPKTGFTIIVPYRNESQNLPGLLQSLLQLSYPSTLFEVYFVNDASEDDSTAIITHYMKEAHFRYSILENQRFSGAPKKDAILHAVKQGNFPWMVTTDADCTVPRAWLEWYDQIIQSKSSKMVCGPVWIDAGERFLEQFQLWDVLAMQAATFSGFGWRRPFLCNGANLAFKASAFFEVNGYEGNNNLASGDDVFLLEKIKRLYPNEIRFVKNPMASVQTKPQNSLKKVLAQRIRWASKTSKIHDPLSKMIGSVVFLTNMAFILAFVSCFIYPMQIAYFALFLLLKLCVDFVLLATMASFFRRSVVSLSIWLSHLSYPFMVVWVFVNSWKGSYEWKGRTFKK